MSPAAPVLQSEKITPGDEIDIREIDEYVYKGRWWKNKSLFRLNSLLLLVLIASAGNGYDGSMMNGLQTLEIWREEFGTPTGSILGLFNAAQNLGGIASLPLQAYLTDTYGRRKAICFGCAVMLAGTAMQTASSTVGVFIGARVLIGFGNGFSGNAAPCLISELAYPTQRASVVALYNTLWYSGSIIAALTTLGTFSIRNSWAWRIPSLLQGFQPIIQVTLIWLVAESPRWLVSKGREEEARAVLAKYHTEDNNMEHPLVEFEMKEISAGIEMDRMANATTWKTLFATPGNRRRMRIIIAVAFFSQWSGNGIASYYLNIVLRSIGITSELIQNVFNVSLQIFNLITAMTAAILVERLGRRFLFITSACGMCVAMVAWTLCAYGYNIRGSQAAGNCIMFLIFAFYAAYNLAMCPLVVAYPCEILPFSIRAKGLVVNTTIITTALVFNQYVNPIALEAIGWYYYIVYCVWLAFEAVFLWRYVVETKGLTLEETSRVFDGEAKVREAAVLDDLSTRRGSDQESPSLEGDEKQKTLSGYTSHVERV